MSLENTRERVRGYSRIRGGMQIDEMTKAMPDIPFFFLLHAMVDVVEEQMSRTDIIKPGFWAAEMTQKARPGA